MKNETYIPLPVMKPIPANAPKAILSNCTIDFDKREIRCEGEILIDCNLVGKVDIKPQL